MRIAYLVNQYPKISHTFIRREIAAIECAGLSVRRFSIRSMRGAVVDPADVAEAGRTTVILEQGVVRVLAAVVRRLASPRFWSATWLALAMARRSARGMFVHLAYLAEACVFADLVRGCDLVHAHFGTNAATVARLARRLGAPAYSLTVHGPEEFEHVASLDLPGKVHDANAVIVDCTYSRGQVLRWLAPARWPDVHIVRSMMSDAYRDAPPVALPGRRRLVCVARLEVEKGLPLLIDALRLLPPDRRPADVAVVGDGSQRLMLERRAAGAGVGELVRFVGWADEAGVRGHMLDADVVILPSLAENLPVTLIDAFSLGRPVIATILAGIPELVEPGVSGWLVPAGDEQALAAAIGEAMALPISRLDAMGRAGRARAVSLHDSRRQAQALNAAFSHATGAARS